MAKREGILSRLFRDRAADQKEAEEKLKAEAAAKAKAAQEAYGSMEAEKVAAGAAFGGPTEKVAGKAKTDLETLESKLKAAEARRKALADKAAARKKIEEAMAKAEAAKKKAEDLEAKEKAEKHLAELREKLAAAKAEAAKERSLAEAKKDVQALRAKLEETKAKAKAARAAAEAATYVVKPGDSLSAIAKKLMGDANLWPKLYEANKDIIGDNPNLIHPGQEFKIPDVD